MVKKIHIQKHLKSVALFVFLIACISFVEKKQNDKECQQVNIQITNNVENYFLNERDILDLTSARGRDLIVGAKLINIPLKTIEKRIEINSFVESVEVDKDHKGNLNIQVRQSRPIARIFYGDTSLYIGNNQALLPLSKRYTSRVMIVRGAGIKKYVHRGLQHNAIDSSFYAMLSHINSDPFLKSQLAEMKIEANGEIVFHPQVSKQQLVFGKPENIEEKFEKMKVLYTTILPDKGWNYYNSVNLKFKDQIICE